MMVNKNLRVKSLKEIAERIMFVGLKNEDLYGWQFRKNKSSVDINNAIRKARNPKNGLGKVEYELGFLELYLKDIFKPDRSVKELKK